LFPFVLLIEEARRLSEERLLAEQAKTEVASLRKHYSEADVNLKQVFNISIMIYF